jgi:hypothetical protein
MAEPVERPTLGVMPKLAIGLLAALGLLTVVGWITSLVFGLLRLALVVALVVLVVLWATGRGRDA